jgi:hypothetical protein
LKAGSGDHGVKFVTGRRRVLKTFALSITASAIASAAARPATAVEPALTPPGAARLDALKKRLAQLPRRRDFKTVPMILDHEDQWDYEALKEVFSYRPWPRQVWDNTEIGGPWLNLMRNALNTQIWSYKHPDFLTVSVTHGTALLALYDQVMWDKYQLTRLAGDEFKTNTLILEKTAATIDPANYENPAGPFSGEDNSIPALMQRGVVFMSCHNGIWEHAAALIKLGINPDKLSHPALAAELTDHLLDGAVLIPGASGTWVQIEREPNLIGETARSYGSCFQCPLGLGCSIPWFSSARRRWRPAERVLRNHRRQCRSCVMQRQRPRSHSLVPPRCRFRAASTQLIKAGPAKGLARKQMAPAFSARARTLSSGKAVMKINDALWPRARTCVRRSRPLMAGICTSAMTQDESLSWPDCKNSSADANVWTGYPCEPSRLLVAARTDASSSITEITECVDKTSLPDAEQGACLSSSATQK